MKVIVTLVIVLFSLAPCAAQNKPCVTTDENPYPNELPTLKIHRDAKWKSLRPYVSTQEQVHKVLGEPFPFYDEVLRTDVAGYDGGFDWTIVVAIVGKGGDLPDSVVDRLDNLELYPKRRISLVGADFSAFMPMSAHDESRPDTTHYYDACGLRYVVYAEDTPDGLFHIGDLKVVVYGGSQEAFEKLTHKP